MTYASAEWEQASDTVDVFGQPTYADPITIACWLEAEGAGGGSSSDVGVTSSRANISQTILEQTRRPELSLFFDGDDSNVRSFKLTDRFTPATIAAAGIRMMPTVIVPMYGPPFANLYPWAIVVAF